MKFKFSSDKQRKAAKIILKRCSGENPPNKAQLSRLVAMKSGYKDKSRAREFLKDFIRDEATPVTVSQGNVVREDLAGGVVK